MVGRIVVYCVLTWDDGHYHHVEHVVQQQRDGHRDQDQLALVRALLQRVPPLLPVLADGLVAGQEGDVEVVDAHDAGDPCVPPLVSILWSLASPRSTLPSIIQVASVPAQLQHQRSVLQP